MSEEIIRDIHMEGMTVQVHIHLSEQEIRRILLPLMMQELALATRLQSAVKPTVANPSTWSNE